MKGKWKVSHNYAGGEKLIQVYRQLDVNDVDHAGNREYQPGFFETDEEAQALADSLNTKQRNMDRDQRKGTGRNGRT